MNEQNNQTSSLDGSQLRDAHAVLDLDSDAPLTPACPLNPGDGECEACQ
jgi:hypothetical protein